ncbi:MAG TPA: heme-binding protein [Verrucomicrobiales bacterium]|mgnify:CR=1 FL=1|nr:heme-binding protein [Verrucomicrobiales bacterium]HRJ08755.1 discoidin domain-containing protein [Prosthecobacter sp.]HRK14314.1 discoidin domain-containing protein [Prosthecobacter sp.]
MLRLTLPFLILLQALSLKAAEPLKALLITGGCCHDYAKQHEVIAKGIQSRANVRVDVIWTDDKSTNPPLPVYDKADWAKSYDIIIHDECAASMNNKETLTRILDAHQTIPSIQLHCAMHSFRTGEDRWFKRLGLQSNSHGPQEPIAITFVDKEHPITKTLADWTTIKEELYNNVNVFDAHPLAMGRQLVKGKAVDAIVAWTNEKAGARSFSTTIGHNTETVADARYLDLITRGLLWACDKLTPDYLVPFTGQNKVTFVAAKPAEAPKPAPAPKNATGIKASASSEETGKNNFAWRAVDNDENTRWCASGPDYPQWLQLELEKPQTLTGIETSWENNGVYQFKVEGSADGKTWTTLFDGSANEKNAPYSNDFAKADGIRFVKVHALGKKSGGWASIREVRLKGPGIKAVTAKPSNKSDLSDPSDKTDYSKSGNVPPRIVKLTPEQEAAILKDVKVADGFEATLFANSAAANYPVFVAAEPDGTLYVSSDGNGSLGRNPKRGRVIRLRDLDGDGRADETKVFCEVDAPRGLVWDHDRLYLVHPPHLSEFIDADHDGVAEKQNILVKDIAFGYKDRPADHTTNGLSLGIDGWLYIAGGDFGFMKATGTDGKTLQHRGGGVIRVRPDGTGLEIYSTGTRNILEVAISPLMDIFARDNTNDGGGWNVRFHHFTGLDDHGYPRLYKNFNDECIQPLADYGGGSGCGAVYIDEPGFGTWNNAPFTCDWGSGALWHHQVKPKGATFEETRKPEPFIKMTRPTDADVDGLSRVYCASWKGATFDWAGPDVGYIVQVRPKGFKAEPLPDFAKAKDEELVKVLESASNRRRMEAQRELVRRDSPSRLREEKFSLTTRETQIKAIDSRKEAASATNQTLAAFAADKSNDLSARVAALFGMTLRLAIVPWPEDLREISKLNADSALSSFVLRAGADAMFLGDRSEMMDVRNSFAIGLKSKDSRTRFEAVVSITRQLSNYLQWPGLSMVGMSKAEQHKAMIRDLSAPMTDHLDDDDPTIAHVAFRALAMMNAHEANFATVDNPNIQSARRKGALLALMHIHTLEVVTGLIERLGKATDPAMRQGILAALCRLHFKEGEWKGDSWGTRPDTRGPYYQPEAWGETPKIAVALKDALAKATPEEAAFLVKELNRNRIQFNEAQQRILELAKKDPKVLPELAAQMAVAEEVPVEAVPLLVGLVRQVGPVGPATLSQAIIALSKTDSADGVSATLAALELLKKLPESGKDYDAALAAFLNAPKLENHHQLVEQIAERGEWPVSVYANAALLNLANRKTGSPESIQLTQKALDKGWADPKHRKLIIDAISASKHMPSAAKVLAALDDPDAEVKGAAERAAKAMRITKIEDKTPKIMTLKPEEVLAAVLKEKGNVALGEQIFTKATCVACHTVKETEAQKGPYLGNIAQTYKRPELAEAILDPNKTIAQGFASEMITMKDGTAQMGFITQEGANEVKLRNIAAQEFTFKTADIKERQKLPMSMMPPGLMMNFTVLEFASLLDYLESLAKH